VPTSFAPWTITASTPQELEAEQIARGPCGRLACTEWSIDPTFSFRPAGQECALTVVSTKVTVTYRLPIWEPARPLPSRAREWWRRKLPYILAHEGGHRDLAVATANQLQRALSSLPPETSCPLLVKRARDEAGRQIQKGEQRQRDYDARTEAELRAGGDW
jgi:predicted secreted Zn-dependent protease